MASPGQVTQLLVQIKEGDRNAANQLMTLLYDELRRVAANTMRRERPGHTLQPTALVHEVYMRLVNVRELAPENRAHFFSIAASSMRQVLVDHARRKLAEKRGGAMHQRVDLDDSLAISEQEADECIALHGALKALEALDVRQSHVLEMHYFGGNTVEEISDSLGISERTVKRDLQSGRSYIRQQLAYRGIKTP